MPEPSRLDLLREEAKALDDEQLLARLREIRTKRNVKMSVASEKPETKEKKVEKIKKALGGLTKDELIAMLKEMK